ncbi:putative gag-pol polyprotein [Tanacetum coccineum]
MSDHNSSDLCTQRQEMSVENVSSGLVPQGQKASDYDNSDPQYYNPAHGHAEDNNNDQAPNASFQEAEFINPFCTRMDRENEFLNGPLKEEVYVAQPEKGTLNQYHPEKSLPSEKALYGIKQALRALDELSNFLISKAY